MMNAIEMVMNKTNKPIYFIFMVLFNNSPLHILDMLNQFIITIIGQVNFHLSTTISD